MNCVTFRCFYVIGVSFVKHEGNMATLYLKVEEVYQNICLKNKKTKLDNYTTTSLNSIEIILYARQF